MTLYRKYRPQTFQEVVGQEHVTTTLRNALKLDRVSHAYLFTGPRGVGKTSIARILAKAVNCLDEKIDAGDKPCGKCASCMAIEQGHFIDLIEIDAASNRSVEDIRELREKINFSPSVGRKKVYIIDEVHMLTREAFNALLKTLEEPPAHSIFVFATTEIHKVPETIISRCQKFDFRFGDKQMIKENLKTIAAAEKVKVDDELLELVFRASGGSFRDAQSIFDQLLGHIKDKDFTLEKARQILNLTHEQEVDNFLKFLQDKKLDESLSFLRELSERGTNFEQFLNNVISRLRERAIEQVSSGESARDTLAKLRIFLRAVADSKLSSLEILPLEMAAIDIVDRGETIASGSDNSQKQSQAIVEKSDKQAGNEAKKEKPQPAAKKFKVLSNEAKIAILELVGQKSKPLAILLGSAIWSMDENSLVISVEYPFHKDTITSKNNYRLICENIDAVLDGHKKVECVIAKQADMEADIGEIFELA
jgi:DNA polymerase III subunit gamma/tau